MADIDRTRIIAATSKEIWELLADFGAISSWVDNIDHSCLLVRGTEPVGTTRRLQVGRSVLVERIVAVDSPDTLAYEIEGLPGWLGRVTNRWTLQPQEASTAVTLTSTVEIGARPDQRLAERVLARALARQSDKMLAGLARRMEGSDD
ncbi:SRPBCC family protein [Mycolicibacterium sp. XJ1819]